MRAAIIPARGGSKRIPRKNIKTFCGKPMLAWPIQAALDSGCFDRVIVSTDDAEIADLARRCGAETPFMRPADLADDRTGTAAVMAQALSWLKTQGSEPDPVCCLYATAAFVAPEDIRRGLKTLQTTGCDFAFSVAPYPSPIQRAFRISDQGRIEMFQPEQFQVRSQDLEPAYHDAGQFYWGRAAAWTRDVIMFSDNSAPVVIPPYRVQDIDTPEDWTRAEYIFESILRDQTS